MIEPLIHAHHEGLEVLPCTRNICISNRNSIHPSRNTWMKQPRARYEMSLPAEPWAAFLTQAKPFSLSLSIQLIKVKSTDKVILQKKERRQRQEAEIKTKQDEKIRRNHEIGQEEAKGRIRRDKKARKQRFHWNISYLLPILWFTQNISNILVSATML